MQSSHRCEQRAVDLGRVAQDDRLEPRDEGLREPLIATIPTGLLPNI